MHSPLMRLGLALSALLAGCPAGPTIDTVDSGVTPPDLINAPQEAQLRVSHFMAGVPPFDVCVKRAGETDYIGPLIRQQTMRNGGVFFGSVSAYLTLPVANYEVKIVSGMATSCSVAPLITGAPDLPLPQISAGRRYTAIAAADAERPGKLITTLKLVLIEDDLSTQGGQVRLRFINASPDVSAAEFGLGEMGTYQQMFRDATYGGFGTPVANAVGAYTTTGQQTNATFTVRSSVMGSDLLVVRNKVSLAAGSSTTLFLVGLRASMGTTVNPLKLVQCEDSKPASAGLAACMEVTP